MVKNSMLSSANITNTVTGVALHHKHQNTWNTIYRPNVCLTHCTTYSVSDSVSSTGMVDDLNKLPRLANSGTARSCSTKGKISITMTRFLIKKKQS